MTSNTILFYEDEYYMLSNFSAHQVVIKGHTYPTAEHAYQAAKFIDEALHKQVQQASSAWKCKKLSRKQYAHKRQDWSEVKVIIMKEILLAKFEQHEDVRAALIESGDAVLHENSPIDFFWGCGKDMSGKSMLGKLWMEIRDEQIKKAA